MMRFNDGLTDLQRLAYVGEYWDRVPQAYRDWAEEYRQSPQGQATLRHLKVKLKVIWAFLLVGTVLWVWWLFGRS